MTRSSSSLCSVAAIALLAFPVFVAVADDPEELTALRNAFEQQKILIREDVGKLDDKYVGALKRKLESETSAGNLNEVIALREEIEAHGDGTSYEEAQFTLRLSDNATVRSFQDTYLKARRAVQASHDEKIARVAASYHDQLSDLVVELTKASRIDDAIAVTAERDLLTAALSIPVPADETMPEEKEAPEPVRVRAFITAKAQAEIFVNGEPLYIRNGASDGDAGVDGKSPFFEVSPGTTVVVKLRSHFVHRSAALAFELPDHDRILFFKSSDFKVLGDVEPKDVDSASIEAAPAKHPVATVPDPYWVDKWEDHRLKGGGFLQPDPQGEWVVWGTVLTDEMLEREK